MINGNILRHGNFTSSEIVALTSVAKDKVSFGKPALTYIEECNMERNLGRSLTDEVNARPMLWGKLGERFAFERLPLDYSLNSDETLLHPTINCWAGSPDGFKFDEGKTVIDIKAPYTLKSFCRLVQPLYMGLSGMEAVNYIRENHKDGEKYYWQLVSNAVITGSRFAELIIYMPYQSDLKELREMAEGDRRFYFIWSAEDDEIPYLPDGGFYQSINTIRFEVPQADEVFLTACVTRASRLLQTPGTMVQVTRDEAVSATIIEEVNLSKLKKIA